METKFTKSEFIMSNNIGIEGQKYVPAYFVHAEHIIIECKVLPEGDGYPAETIKESKERAEANAKLLRAARNMFDALVDIVEQYEKTVMQVPADLSDSIRVMGKQAIKYATE